MKKVLGRLRRPTRHPATQLTQMSLLVESLVKNMISEIQHDARVYRWPVYGSVMPQHEIEKRAARRVVAGRLRSVISSLSHSRSRRQAS